MSAFLNAIGSVVAGSYVTARLSLMLPADFDLTDAYVTWSILDQQGRQWNQGEGVSLTVEPSQTNPSVKTVASEVQVSIPSNLPANEGGTTYQMRWTLSSSNAPMYSFENFAVLPATVPNDGPVDAVELVGDDVNVETLLPLSVTEVQYEAFRGNAKLFSLRPATTGEDTATGRKYKGTVTVVDYASASLDPITVVWSYKEGGASRKETSQIFVVTPVVLDAVKDLQTWLNRAYSANGTAPNTSFDSVDFIKYLRLGRDAFNAASAPTDFSLLAAAGPIRWFWLGYSQVIACRSQYLAEGMKAFDYQGQIVQLNVDKTQYWESIASNMESQLEAQVKPFKAILAKRGINGGDGSSMALRAGAVGVIGLAVHGMSPQRGMYGLNAPLTPYMR